MTATRWVRLGHPGSPDCRLDHPQQRCQAVGYYRQRGGQVSWQQIPTNSATPAARVPARSALLGPRPCDQERGGAECNGASGEERQRQQVRGSGERQLALLGADP
jgi:hypothetical protein